MILNSKKILILRRNNLSFYNDIQGLEEKLFMHGNKIFPVCPNRDLTANVLLFVCFCFCFILFCFVLFLNQPE